MINCGATENVRQLCALHEHVRVVIIDSHRPIWHGYRHTGDEMLVILDPDDPVKLEAIPEYDDADDNGKRPCSLVSVVLGLLPMHLHRLLSQSSCWTGILQQNQLTCCSVLWNALGEQRLCETFVADTSAVC